MVSDLTDKEQLELFKKWWNNYGKSVTIAIVIGLCIGFGWRYWHQYQSHRAERASDLYYQIQAATLQNQSAAAQQLTTQLMQNYANTPYASLIALSVAKKSVLEKNYDEALQQLNWVMKQSKSSSLKQIARLRAARILLTQQKHAAALQMLQVINDSTYQPLIDSVKGDIYTAMGNTDAAKKSYEAAQIQAHTMGIVDPSLQMKASQ